MNSEQIREEMRRLRREIDKLALPAHLKIKTIEARAARLLASRRRWKTAARGRVIGAARRATERVKSALYYAKLKLEVRLQSLRRLLKLAIIDEDAARGKIRVPVQVDMPKNARPPAVSIPVRIGEPTPAAAPPIWFGRQNRPEKLLPARVA